MRSKGDVVFVVDINPNESHSPEQVSYQFRLKMKFIADIVNSLVYGGENVRIGLSFLSHTRVCKPFSIYFIVYSHTISHYNINILLI